jgi:hypothetical protein
VYGRIYRHAHARADGREPTVAFDRSPATRPRWALPSSS